jgi:hypothetical protein
MSYCLIVISPQGYLKRAVDLPTKDDVLPVPGLDPKLKWVKFIEMPLPEIDNETQGMTYKEEIIGDEWIVTDFPFTIADGITEPVTIPRGSFE